MVGKRPGKSQGSTTAPPREQSRPKQIPAARAPCAPPQYHVPYYPIPYTSDPYRQYFNVVKRTDQIIDHNVVILTFDDVITNSHSAYDVARYVFTCSTSGPHLFNVGIYSTGTDRGTGGQVSLVQNGRVVHQVSLCSPSVSGSYVLECSSGDRVWLTVSRDQSPEGATVRGGGMTYFNGVHM